MAALQICVHGVKDPYENCPTCKAMIEAYK
jgi:hypothetical protein